MFANPYNACTTCGSRVVDYANNANVPCGHGGFDRTVPVGVNAVPVREHVDPWKSLCPSWGPVDGCTCKPPCALPPGQVEAEAAQIERETGVNPLAVGCAGDD